MVSSLFFLLDKRLSFLVLLLAAGLFAPRTVFALGVGWADEDIDGALARARAANQLVFVNVHAAHCGQCGQMEFEVWSTEEAAALVDGMVAIRVDSDSPSGQEFQRRYPIMGLPAVLVLDANGRELNRLVGYYNREQWLSSAAELVSGVDPLSEMEAELAANPKSLLKVVALLETYLWRKRIDDAERLLPKVLELDPDNAARQAEKALVALAKYHAYFLGDQTTSEQYWRRFVEEYPGATSIGQGVKATFENARATGEQDAWVDWVCGVAAKNPDLGRLHYSIASWANRGNLRAACLAQSAARAHELGVGAQMDSIAVVLAGSELIDGENND